MSFPGLFFSDESVLCPWVNSVLTVHSSRGKKKKKPTQKGRFKEELIFMRYWFSHSKLFPAIFVCPDEQAFPAHRRSAVDAGQRTVNCRQMWENFRLQVAATFCILQVPYGKSKYKTVFWHLHILKSFLLYSRVFITEFDGRCLSIRANAAS